PAPNWRMVSGGVLMRLSLPHEWGLSSGRGPAPRAAGAGPRGGYFVSSSTLARAAPALMASIPFWASALVSYPRGAMPMLVPSASLSRHRYLPPVSLYSSKVRPVAAAVSVLVSVLVLVLVWAGASPSPAAANRPARTSRSDTRRTVDTGKPSERRD